MISRWNHDSVLDHVVVSNVIDHCVEHAHYPSTVPHVMASSADFLTLVQPQRTCSNKDTHVLYMFLNERWEERKKQARSNKQTRQSNTKNELPQMGLEQTRQSNTKNELPQMGLEPTTLYTLDRALYQLSYRGSSAGWAQISHLIYSTPDEQANMYIQNVHSGCLASAAILYSKQLANHAHATLLLGNFQQMCTISKSRSCNSVAW